MATLALLIISTARADPTRKPSSFPTYTVTAVPSAVPTAVTLAVDESPFTVSFIGAAQNFKVPVNVTSITVTLYGGSGGYVDSSTGAGGKGSMISSIIPVIPGEMLMVTVGSAGGYSVGGYNGGGATIYSAGGGGGATDIRKSPYTLEDRILIAGGGGGGALDPGTSGGDGGVEATE